MKKLTFALAAAAFAGIGFAGHADAQSYYPPTRSSGVPTHVQGASGRSGTYGTYGSYGTYPAYPNYPGQYPQQYPTTNASREHRDWDRHDRRDDDRDRYDRRSNSGSGYGVSRGVPTHVAAQASSRSYNNSDRERRSDRDRR